MNVRVDIAQEDPAASSADPSVTRPHPIPHPVVQSSESPTVPAASPSAKPSTTHPTPRRSIARPPGSATHLTQTAPTPTAPAAEIPTGLEDVEGQVNTHVEQIQATQARDALADEPVVQSHDGVVLNNSRAVSSSILSL